MRFSGFALTAACALTLLMAGCENDDDALENGNGVQPYQDVDPDPATYPARPMDQNPRPDFDPDQQPDTGTPGTAVDPSPETYPARPQDQQPDAAPPSGTPGLGIPSPSPDDSDSPVEEEPVEKILSELKNDKPNGGQENGESNEQN